METSRASTALPNDGPPVWPRWLLAVYLSGLVLLLVAISVACVTADAAERRCLDSLTPLVPLLVAFSDWCTPWLLTHPLTVGLIPAATLALGALGGLLFRRSKGARPAFALAAAASAVVAQAALFGQQVALGGSLYAVAGILLVIWRFLPGRVGPGVIGAETAPAVGSPAPVWLPILEAVALTAITVIAALYYFYALNQLPDDFDGELALEMAISTSWHGVMHYSFERNLTPSGFIYRLFHYMALNSFGTTLLATRMVSAWSGVLIVVLMYGFLRRIGGVAAALAGGLLIATDPIHLVWSRADMFPYAYPSIVAIPLCWATYAAVTTKRLSAFLLVAFLMAACCHVFPSGATVFLVPLAMAVLYLLPDVVLGRQRWRTLAGAGAIGLGAVLWLVGISVGVWLATGEWRWVDPASRNPGKALWLTGGGSFGERMPVFFQQIADNVDGFVTSVFVTPRWMYHYTPVAGVGIRPGTYLPAAAALLSALGFVVCLLHPRRKVAVLLVLWVLAASLPGVLSTEADARRVATIFPALIALAALTLAGGFRLLDFLYGKRAGLLARIALLGVLLPMVGLLHGGLYFRRPPSWPGSTLLARAVQSYLTPGTMVLMAPAPIRDAAPELNYLLLDQLRRNPSAGWYALDPPDWPTIAFHPRVRWDAYYYQDTYLRDQVASAAERSWSRFVFLVQEVPTNLSKVEFLRHLFPDAEYQRRVIAPEGTEYNFHAFVLSPQSVQRVSLPLAKVIGAPALPDPSRVLAGTGVRLETEPAATSGAGPSIVIRAGLWQEKQSWESIRVENAADATLSIDGHPLQATRWEPLVPGVHTLEVSAPLSAPFPLVLQTRSLGEESFRPLDGARLLAPQVSDVSEVRPAPILSYPGYDPAVDGAPIEPGFGTDFAVSPSGRVALLGVFADGWKVRTFLPDGKPGSGFEAPLADGAAGTLVAIAFAGDERVVLLQAGKLHFFDLDGNLQREVSLPPDAASRLEDIAANADEEVFIASPEVKGLLVFDSAGGQFTTVERPGVTDADPPRLMRLGAASHGRVVALDSANNVNLYLAEGSGPRRWRWMEARPSGMQNPVATIQVRRDGWLFVRHAEETDIRVYDAQLNQRIADQPDFDLTTQSRRRLMSRLLGFDDQDNLYSWAEGYGAILRSSPRAAQR